MPAGNNTIDHSQNGIQTSSNTDHSDPGRHSIPRPSACVICRHRKVKCDKRHPCGNCEKHGVDCVFPAEPRPRPKVRKRANAELLERLRNVEDLIKTIGEAALGRGRVQATNGENNSDAPSQQEMEQPPPASVREADHWKANSGESTAPTVLSDARFMENDPTAGRLFVHEGRSRHINSTFWASLNDEVEDIKELLMLPSDEEDEEKDHDSNTLKSHKELISTFSSTNVDMHPLHPKRHSYRLWTLFKERVEPLVKVLHIPSMEPRIISAMATENKDRIPRSTEALLFAIYYAATTSASPEECESVFGQKMQSLLSQYRFGVEQALARANFLQTDQLAVLQASIIFLISLRQNEASRVTWTLTGIVVRMAQNLGLHRDGTNFGLPPFDIEMRRRIWCHVCILDARAIEDYGCDSSITGPSFNTQVPLNVNDSDLRPNMSNLPRSRTGFTDMTFSLVRFEIADVYRRMHCASLGFAGCDHTPVSLEQQERWISEVQSRIEEKHLRGCDMTFPLHQVIATVSRLIVSKMWLMVYQPYQRLRASLPQDKRDKLFTMCVKNIEDSLRLETSEDTQRWAWIFKAFIQWHAIAFLLSELCERTKGELVARAWRAIETTISRRKDDCYQRKACPWGPLHKLVSRARAAREAGVLRESLRSPTGPRERSQEPREYTTETDLLLQTTEVQQQRQQQDAEEGVGGDLGGTYQPLGIGVGSTVPLTLGSERRSGTSSSQIQPYPETAMTADSLQQQIHDSRTSLSWISTSAPNMSGGLHGSPESSDLTRASNLSSLANIADSQPGNYMNTSLPDLGDVDDMDWAGWDDLIMW